MACDPACVKIIIDSGGRMPRAARFLADAAEGLVKAYKTAKDSGAVTPELEDELHALSELDCHRAAMMIEWGEQLHKRAVDKLGGGEYDGAWVVDGVKGIHKKP